MSLFNVESGSLLKKRISKIIFKYKEKKTTDCFLISDDLPKVPKHMTDSSQPKS